MHIPDFTPGKYQAPGSANFTESRYDYLTFYCEILLSREILAIKKVNGFTFGVYRQIGPPKIKMAVGTATCDKNMKNSIH